MDYQYGSITSSTWNPFEDSESQALWGIQCSKRPENRRFDVLSTKRLPRESIIVHTCKPDEFYQATTPWGELEIKKSGLASYDIFRGRALIGKATGKLVGAAKYSFPLGGDFKLKGNWQLSKRLEAQTDSGTVTIMFETGKRTISSLSPRRVMKRREYNSLTDQEKKKVVETDDYDQWRFALSGVLPASDDDLLGVLAMDLCRNRLYSEYVRSTGA